MCKPAFRVTSLFLIVTLLAGSISDAAASACPSHHFATPDLNFIYEAIPAQPVFSTRFPGQAAEAGIRKYWTVQEGRGSRRNDSDRTGDPLSGRWRAPNLDRGGRFGVFGARALRRSDDAQTRRRTSSTPADHAATAEWLLKTIRQGGMTAGAIKDSEKDRFTEIYKALSGNGLPDLLVKRMATQIVKKTDEPARQDKLWKALGHLLLTEVNRLRSELTMTDLQISSGLMKLSASLLILLASELQKVDSENARSLLNDSLGALDPAATAMRYAHNLSAVAQHVNADANHAHLSRAIASQSYGATDPIAEADKLMAKYDTVISHLADKEAPEITRTIARIAYTAVDPKARANQLLATHARLLQHVTAIAGNEIAKSIAITAIGAANPLTKADHYLKNFRRVVQHMTRQGYAEIAQTVASRSFAARDPLALAKKHVSNYEAVRLYVEKTADPKIARSIARAACTSTQPFVKADVMLTNYRAVIAHVRGKGGKNIARTVAGLVLTSTQPLEDADALLLEYARIVDYVKSEQNDRIAQIIAGKSIAAQHPITAAVLYLANYNRVAKYLEGTVGEKTAKSMASRSFFALDPVAQADKYVGVYQQVVAHVSSVADERIARLIAAKTVTSPNPISKADEYVKNYSRIVKHVSRLGGDKVARTLAARAFYLPDSSAVVETYLARYRAVVARLTRQTGGKVARMIAVKLITRANPEAQADLYWKNYQSILTHMRDKPGEPVSRTLAARSFTAKDPLAAAELLYAKNYSDQRGYWTVQDGRGSRRNDPDRTGDPLAGRWRAPNLERGGRFGAFGARSNRRSDDAQSQLRRSHSSEPISEQSAREIIASEDALLKPTLDEAPKYKPMQPAFGQLPEGQKFKASAGVVTIDLAQTASAEELRRLWRQGIHYGQFKQHDRLFIKRVRRMAPEERVPGRHGIIEFADAFVEESFKPDEKILEVGVGFANLALTLLALGAERIIGMDLSARMLKLAQETVGHPQSEALARHPTKSPSERISLLSADGLNMPFQSDSFDRVFSRQTITGNAPWLRARLFEEVYRVLKPGGRFDLWEYLRFEDESGSTSSWYWSLEEWADELMKIGFLVRASRVGVEDGVLHARKPHSPSDEGVWPQRWYEFSPGRYIVDDRLASTILLVSDYIIPFAEGLKRHFGPDQHDALVDEYKRLTDDLLPQVDLAPFYVSADMDQVHSAVYLILSTVLFPDEGMFNPEELITLVKSGSLIVPESWIGSSSSRLLHVLTHEEHHRVWFRVKAENPREIQALESVMSKIIQVSSECALPDDLKADFPTAHTFKDVLDSSIGSNYPGYPPDEMWVRIADYRPSNGEHEGGWTSYSIQYFVYWYLANYPQKRLSREIQKALGVIQRQRVSAAWEAEKGMAALTAFSRQHPKGLSQLPFVHRFIPPSDERGYFTVADGRGTRRNNIDRTGNPLGGRWRAPNLERGGRFGAFGARPVRRNSDAQDRSFSQHGTFHDASRRFLDKHPLLRDYEPTDMFSTLDWLVTHRQELENRSLSYLVQAFAAGGRLPEGESAEAWQRSAGALDYYLQSSLLQSYTPADLISTLQWLAARREALSDASLSFLIAALDAARRLPQGELADEWQRSAGAYDFYLGSPLLQAYMPRDMTQTLEWLNVHRQALGNNSLTYLVRALQMADKLPGNQSFESWQRTAAAYDFYVDSPHLQSHTPVTKFDTMRWLVENREKLGGKSLVYLTTALGVTGHLPTGRSLEEWQRYAGAYERAIQERGVIVSEIQRIWETGLGEGIYRTPFTLLFALFNPELLLNVRTHLPLSPGYRRAILKIAWELYGKAINDRKSAAARVFWLDGTAPIPDAGLGSVAFRSVEELLQVMPYFPGAWMIVQNTLEFVRVYIYKERPTPAMLTNGIDSPDAIHHEKHMLLWMRLDAKEEYAEPKGRGSPALGDYLKKLAVEEIFSSFVWMDTVLSPWVVARGLQLRLSNVGFNREIVSQYGFQQMDDHAWVHRLAPQPLLRAA